MMCLTELLEHYQKSYKKLTTMKAYNQPWFVISKLAAYGACEKSLRVIQNFLS